MKVLQINSVCGSGSTGRIVTDLADILKEKGNECWIAYGRGTASKKYETIKISNSKKTYLNGLKSRIFDSEGFNAKKETLKLIDEIKIMKPDIIHLHNLHGYYLNVEILFKYFSTIKIPIFWTLHDCWPFSPHSAYIDYDSNSKLPKSVTRKELNEYPKSWLMNNSSNNFEKKKDIFTSANNMTIICPSNWLADMTKQTFLNIYPIKVINNGIDLELFKPNINKFRKENLLEGKKILLGVASVWEERKGLKYFNKLSYDLDRDFKIVLVGINKKDKKNLNKDIMTIEKTSNVKELADIYSSADLFINPTLEDNFPTTNIESLACGTPVITFDTGGSPEPIDKKTGKVVEKGNYSDLFNEVINFDYDIDYKDICTKKSKKYDKNNVYSSYIKLYQDIEKNQFNLISQRTER